MKKKLFGIVLILIIVALAYYYLKGKQATEANTDSNDEADEAGTPALTEKEITNIRICANECYKDLKGWGRLEPSPYKPILTYTQEQFAKFLEIYKTLYSKGFQHHIDHQSMAWNRTSELYQIKLSLNRLIASV